MWGQGISWRGKSYTRRQLPRVPGCMTKDWPGRTFRVEAAALGAKTIGLSQPLGAFGRNAQVCWEIRLEMQQPQPGPGIL